MTYGIYYRKTGQTNRYALSTVCLDPEVAKKQARLTGDNFHWHDWAVVPNSTSQTLPKTVVDSQKLP